MNPYRVRSVNGKEVRRLRNVALPPVDRAALYPLDAFEHERQMRRELFLLDCALGVMWGIIVLCLIGVVMGL